MDGDSGVGWTGCEMVVVDGVVWWWVWATERLELARTRSAPPARRRFYRRLRRLRRTTYLPLPLLSLSLMLSPALTLTFLPLSLSFSPASSPPSSPLLSSEKHVT